MALFIALLSQKGGVGKSTLARLIAREYAVGGWRVKIADMDTSQGTCTNWNRRRLHFGVDPGISVEAFGRVSEVMKINDYDLVVFDGAPHSSRMTKEIAQHSHLVIIPTGVALDDLEPAVKLAHELKDSGIDKKKIYFALNGIGSSEAELEEAMNYLSETRYQILNGAIPERTAYRKASDLGKSLTETSFPSLNDKAAELAQSVIDQLEKHT